MAAIFDGPQEFVDLTIINDFLLLAQRTSPDRVTIYLGESRGDQVTIKVIVELQAAPGRRTS